MQGLSPLPKCLLLAVGLNWAGSTLLAQSASETVSKFDHAMGKMISLEQNVNDKIENTEVFESIQEHKLPHTYRPRAELSFLLRESVINAEELDIYSNDDKFLKSFITTDEGIRFFIHPHSAAYFENYNFKTIVSPIQATPTSSYRSLIAWSPELAPTGIKVGLDELIGNTSRMLGREQIETSAAMSSWLNTGALEKWTQRGVVFIDEPVNIIHKESNQGFTIRKYPQMPNGNYLMPYFSFVSKDANGKIALVEAINKSELSPEHYFRQKIIDPLVRMYFSLLFEEGLISQPHEQNFLLEMDKSGAPTGRYFIRDLGGMSFNSELRNRAGKNFSFIPKGILPSSYMSMSAVETFENFSDYLIHATFYSSHQSAMKTYPELSSAWLEKNIFESVLGEISSYFPNKKFSALNEIQEAVSAISKKSDCPTHFMQVSGVQ